MDTSLLENDWEIQLDKSKKAWLWEERSKKIKTESEAKILLREYNESGYTDIVKGFFKVFVGIKPTTNPYEDDCKYKSIIFNSFDIVNKVNLDDRWGVFFGFDSLHEALEFIEKVKTYYDRNF